MDRYFIPEDIKQKLDEYAETGCGVGGFLSCVLANDLFGAVGQADDDNVQCIPGIVHYIYNYLPASCHGNKKYVKQWQDRGGQNLILMKDDVVKVKDECNFIFNGSVCGYNKDHWIHAQQNRDHYYQEIPGHQFAPEDQKDEKK